MNNADIISSNVQLHETPVRSQFEAFPLITIDDTTTHIKSNHNSNHINPLFNAFIFESKCGAFFTGAFTSGLNLIAAIFQKYKIRAIKGFIAESKWAHSYKYLCRRSSKQ